MPSTAKKVDENEETFQVPTGYFMLFEWKISNIRSLWAQKYCSKFHIRLLKIQKTAHFLIHSNSYMANIHKDKRHFYFLDVSQVLFNWWFKVKSIPYNTSLEHVFLYTIAQEITIYNFSNVWFDQTSQKLPKIFQFCVYCWTSHLPRFFLKRTWKKSEQLKKCLFSGHRIM